MRALTLYGAIAVLLANLMAGCVGEAESTADPGTKAGGPAQFDDVSGGIEGSITDTELQPIVGALIGILRSDVILEDFTVLSDESGAFSFSNVPPGTHTLAGSALGYASGSRSIEVEAGAITQASLIVDKLASVGPYHVTEILPGTAGGFNYRVTPECMYFSSQIPVQTPVNTLVKTCGGIAGGDFGQPHFIDQFQKDLDWRTMVAELVWQPQSTVTGRGLSMDINAPNITRGTGGSIDQADPYTFDKESANAPIITRIDLPDTLVERGIPESDWYSYPGGEGCESGSCDWFIRLFAYPCDISANAGGCGATPVDFGAPQDMPVTLYFSIFYRDQAEPDFTALPDM